MVKRRAIPKKKKMTLNALNDQINASSVPKDPIGTKNQTAE